MAEVILTAVYTTTEEEIAAFATSKGWPHEVGGSLTAHEFAISQAETCLVGFLTGPALQQIKIEKRQAANTESQAVKDRVLAALDVT